MERRYNSYNKFLKDKFGTKVVKISIDGGFSCPNRDGTLGRGGCSYCRTDSFTPEVNKDIARQVDEQVVKGKKRHPDEKYIVYFQPFTNTYAEVDVLKRHYDAALSTDNVEVVGLAVGTRADCLDNEKIELINSYQEKYYVSLEIGLESIYNDTLTKINRGHSFEDFCESVELVKNIAPDIDIGVHIILGFPWESREMQLAYLDVLNHYKFKFVKIHHLHIVKGTALAKEYYEKPFKLYSLEEYADFLSEFIAGLDKDIVIQRLFSVCSKDFNIAPDWHLDKDYTQVYLEREFERRGVFQGSNIKVSSSDR